MSAPIEPWIALLGRADWPTDGVEDYCMFLGRALAANGIELTQARVEWTKNGLIGALRQLSRESNAWRGRWVLLQYTALSWSRRGFPFAVLLVLAILRRSGVRVAVVFHEPGRQGGSRPMDRVRGICQDWVIKKLYQQAAKSIFTVPLDTIAWLPKTSNRAAFIPIGANIPERLDSRTAPDPTAKKSVIVFGVTDSLEGAAREVDDISYVMLRGHKTLGQLRLIVLGRGALEAGDLLKKAFHRTGVELVVRGVLPAEEIAYEFESADALLFVRGPVTLRRGSAMAGIATGIPVVGYRGEESSGFLEQAGVEWSPWRDRDALTRGLIRVLSNPARWMELHERNLAVQKNYLSWSRIAKRFQAELAG